MHLLLDALPDPTVVTDDAERILHVNRAFEQLVGLARAELEGRSLSALLPAVRAGPGAQRLAARRPDGSVFEFDLTRGTSVGGQVISTLRCAAPLDAQHVDRLVALGVLSASVAHELSNALSPLMTSLFMLSEQVERVARLLPSSALAEVEELRLLTREARVAADHSRELARDFRAYSRQEDSRLETVDVRQVVESALRMAQSELRHRARVVTSFSAAPPVEARASRLRQVILNLLINAAQAIAPGAVDANEVKVVLRDEGGQVVVEVHDTGSGIAPEHRARLFEPFFTTRGGEGTGLGLSITARLVAEVHGQLRVESSPGRGSRFSVVLPAMAAAASPQERVTRGRVLIIDDEQMVVNAIRISLGDVHEVSVATRPRDALALLEGGARFDVILCDLMMPQMSGIDFHAAVLRCDEAQARRVVFVTGATNARARAFLASVPNEQVDKPFEPAQLRALVTALVTEAQAGQRLATTRGATP